MQSLGMDPTVLPISPIYLRWLCFSHSFAMNFLGLVYRQSTPAKEGSALSADVQAGA